MKAYGYVHRIEGEISYLYFPVLKRFGVFSSSECKVSDIFEFDKLENELLNAKKCEDVQVSYGAVYEVLRDNVKVKADDDVVYSLPAGFFMKTQDELIKDMRVRMFKNKQGVLIYSEVYEEIKGGGVEIEDIQENYMKKQAISYMDSRFSGKVGNDVLKELAKIYSSCRRVKSDYNGFFRAVGFGYIEYLCRDSTRPQEFIQFINESSEKFQPLLQYLFKVKCKLGSSTKNCEGLFLSSSNDDLLTNEFRIILIKYIENHSVELVNTLPLSPSSYISSLKDPKRPPDQSLLILMERALKTRITFLRLPNFSPPDNPSLLHISVISTPKTSNYSIIYTNSQDSEDLFGRNSTDAPLHSYILSINAHIKSLYEKLFMLGSNYDIRLTKYFPDYGEEVSGFWRSFMCVGSEEVQKSCEELLGFVSQSNVVSEVIGLCSYCLERGYKVRMSCGHLYCREDALGMLKDQTEGLYIQNEFEKQKVGCLVCRAELNTEDYKTILLKDYEVYSKLSKERAKIFIQKAEVKQGIFSCKGCGVKEHISQFPFSHSCLCKTCLLKILPKSQCPYCEKLFESSDLKSANLICAVCEKPPKIAPIITHNTHLLCNDCEKSCLDFNSCIICSSQLSASEENLLSSRYYQSCFSCKNYFPDSSISQRKCSCLLCNDCYTQSLNFNSNSCVACGQKLVLSEKTCEICTENFLREEMITLNCEHYYCKECLTKYIITQITAGELVKCPNCAEGIDGIIIHSLVSAQVWDNYNKTSIRKNFKLTDCPKCGSYFETGAKSAKCSNCGHSFCVLCKDPSHRGGCDDIKIKGIIKELESRGERVAQCPGCKSPYTKDEGCEHVACTNPQCLVEFCFTCSCLRGPTLKHGNHYHREDCKFYAKYNGPDKEMKDCEECKKLKKLCPRPKKLQVARRFHNGES